MLNVADLSVLFHFNFIHFKCTNKTWLPLKISEKTVISLKAIHF